MLPTGNPPPPVQEIPMPDRPNPQAFGLFITAEFVPFSKSRNAKPNPKILDRSLNWKVTVRHQPNKSGETQYHVLTCDYSAGIAHCPSYQPNARVTLDYAERIAHETETGRQYCGQVMVGKPIGPDPVDVIGSLIMDASAIDHPTFESWASDCGYDTDSRKAEAIYKQCLAHALALRCSLGESNLAKLREAYANY